ncbi:MAG: cytochrome c [Leptospiraceae bacterium]|nr:cytochrome c [Leptospiraceae bacterium]MDW7975002.1 c-type cytochrome [Leptospiraceae bacterium]
MIRLYIFLLSIITLMLYCKKEPEVYEATPDSINYGSIVYASTEMNCKNCHGVDYKGNGPEARDLDVKVPDFTAELTPEKTPLSYFKAISVGTNNTIKDGYNYHAYYYLTDKAKWGLANFLYSLGKEPKDLEIKKQWQEAVARDMKQVKEIYKENRKWYFGENTPASERTPSPDLEKTIQKTNYTVAKDISISTLDAKRAEKISKAREDYFDGYVLYQNNCQSCHGVGGEGIQGSSHIGLLDKSRYEPIKDIARRKAAYVGIPDLKNTAISKENIQKAHQNYSFTDEQWTTLIQYIKAIVE